MENIDRHRRVAEQIKRHLSGLIQTEVSDPRLGMVGISDVRVSRDYKNATVYITVLKEEEAEDSMAALQSAAGFLRRELSRSLNQRGTPNLVFELDTQIKRGVELSNLIDSVQ